jgi:NAD-dependent DNA ligase
MESKKKGEKVEHIFTSEKDIFDYLGLEYKSPIERNDGRSVIILNNNNNKNNSILEPVVNNNNNNNSKTLKNKKKDFGSKTIQTKKKDQKKTLLIIEEDEDKEKETFLEQVKYFRQKGLSIFSSFNENQLSEFLKYANQLYFNETSDSILNDNEYDLIKEYVESRFPCSQVLKEVGASIPAFCKNKVDLPYEMPSMDKIKPDTKALESWKMRFKSDYVLSCKLDGVSGLYSTEGNNGQGKLYTRGDGKVGLDISHLIPYLNLPKQKNIVIRGEFIIKKKVFLEKYKKEFANPRNLVSGILLQKKIDPKLVDVDFVAYEVLKPILCPFDQMNLLKNLSVQNKVYYQLVSNFDLTNDLLSNHLKDWRSSSIYEIDGIIVTDNHIYPRKSGNPEHAFAFKMVLSDQIAEAKVVDVLWSASKDGYLKPRVQIEPIFLGGVKIEYATGFNASFIESNKIGVGAIIELIRSGDVIPYIKSVKVPAEVIKMPLDPYEWNETKMDIILKNIKDNLEVREKNITSFFKGLEVEGLSSGNIARLCNAGFHSVPAIINMKLEDFLKVEGFQQKMAKKLYEGIQDKLEKVSLVNFMSASNIFGRGFSDKRIELILESYPDILISSLTLQEKINVIKNIKGMADKSAEAFVTKIPDFLEFGKDCGRKDFIYQLESKEINISNPLYNKQIVMTGFRDPNLSELLEKKGAKLGNSVNKNTFVVVVKDENFAFDKTSKIIDAEKLGKPILTLKEFSSNYFSNTDLNKKI